MNADVISLLLFLLFFPRATAPAPPSPPEARPSYKTALLVTGTVIVHALVIAVTNIVITRRYPDHLQSYANTLGVLATVLASIQYFPQIYTTWRLKTVASLSIPMMCVQTPGSFVWAASLAARVGWSGWSTWGVYCVTGCLQGSLLIMGIVFEYRIRKQNATVEEGPEGEVEDGGENTTQSERTPLMGNER